MLGTTHIVFAAALYFSLRLVGFRTNLDLHFFVMIFGSLFPDLDHPKGFLASQSHLFQGMSKMVSRFTVHRGIMHSLLSNTLCGLIAFGVAWYFGWNVMIAFAFWFGYLAHLLSDSLTYTGIRWLQPFRQNRLRGPVVSGSRAEKLLSILLFLIAGYLYLDK